MVQYIEIILAIYNLTKISRTSKNYQIVFVILRTFIIGTQCTSNYFKIFIEVMNYSIPGFQVTKNRGY